MVPPEESTTRKALETVVDHLRPDTCRVVVTDQQLFTRHPATLLSILTHGCHPPTSLSQALCIRLTEELMIARMPIDLRLSLSESSEGQFWNSIAGECGAAVGVGDDHRRAGGLVVAIRDIYVLLVVRRLEVRSYNGFCF